MEKIPDDAAIKLNGRSDSGLHLAWPRHREHNEKPGEDPCTAPVGRTTVFDAAVKQPLCCAPANQRALRFRKEIRLLRSDIDRHGHVFLHDQPLTL